jgi:hypothetical protein
MNPTEPISAPDAFERSTTEKVEEDVALAGVAAAGGLRAFEVGLVVLIGLLICPPLAILVFLVAAPLFVAALALGLVAAILSAPYLLVHHFRGGSHLSVAKHRLRRAGRALVDLLPHRIAADARKRP